MDYRLNNEAIVACVIAQVVSRGPYDIPFVTGMTNLLLQDRIRKKAIATMAEQVEGLKLLLCQLDGMLFGVIVNSMTMLATSRRPTRTDREGDSALPKYGRWQMRLFESDNKRYRSDTV